MKVQNQVRVWPIGQHTSSWHITDMWDRSVSKPISIDGKEPTCRSLRETRSENTQTGSHGGQDIFEHGWLIDIIHYMLGCRFPPFSGINVYFIRDKKIRVQMLHHAVLVVVLLVLLRLALRPFVKSNNDGTTVYASGNLTPNELMHVHRLGEGRLH